MSRQDETAARRFLARQSVGDVIDGTVEQIVEFGAFVEVHEGVHGLLHSSEWTERPEPGTTVRVEILDVDVDRERLSLRPAWPAGRSGHPSLRPARPGKPLAGRPAPALRVAGMAITVVPTLDFMAGVYRRPAAGGPQSERFTHYVAAAGERLPVHGYNPMTSTPVLPTVEALLAAGAEPVLATAAGRSAARLGYDGDAVMHVTVATPGTWTDRLATEVEHRLLGADPGGLLWWFDQPVTPEAVEAEAVAQTVRLVTHAHRGGPPATLADAVEQEGRALAGERGEWDPAAAEAALHHPVPAPKLGPDTQLRGRERQGVVSGSPWCRPACRGPGPRPCTARRRAGCRRGR
jgi:small subunit ribosomal protein S1